jgi:large subunit ribosomal protein L10
MYRRAIVDRTQKTELVEFLGHVFSEKSAVIVAHYKGLSVAEVTDLRQQMREKAPTSR